MKLTRMALLRTGRLATLALASCATPGTDAPEATSSANAAQAGQPTNTCDTVADMESLPPPSSGETLVTVAGYNSPNDGGGGVFQWTPGDTTAPDLGTIFPSTSVGAPVGRWRRAKFDVNTFNIQWFGAVCTGFTADDAAFERALAAANAVGGTILLPAGRTCLMTSQHNLGNINGTGRAAQGITIRGANFDPNFGRAGSARLYLNPPVSSAIPDCSYENGGAMTMGTAADPTAVDVTFEDLALWAGPNLASCILNLTGANTGDTFQITTRRTQFLGNGTPGALATSSSGVYLANAGYITIDGCQFEGFTYDIDASGALLYANDIVVMNSTFYSQSTFASDGTWQYVDPNPMINLPLRQGVDGLQLTGNTFEKGPNAIYVYFLQGGVIAGNWFRGESNDNPGAGTWLNLNACIGCAVTGNYLNQGYSGVYGQGYGQAILGNHFDGGFGVGVQVHAGAATVQGNTFRAAPNVGAIDVQVDSGGNSIGPNDHEQPAVQYYLDLAALSTGYLVGSSSLTSKTNDASAGGWTKVVDGQASLPKTMTLGPSVSAPAAPGSGAFYLFGDSADGKLKVRGSDGTVAILANP
jgi:hypothetical protein